MLLKSALLFLIAFAATASAQIDGAKYAAELHAKYGPALPRETLLTKSGIEMVVYFAANGHVCKIELPPTIEKP
jgi:hypothetical protein